MSFINYSLLSKEEKFILQQLMNMPTRCSITGSMIYNAIYHGDSENFRELVATLSDMIGDNEPMMINEIGAVTVEAIKTYYGIIKRNCDLIKSCIRSANNQEHLDSCGMMISHRIEPFGTKRITKELKDMIQLRQVELQCLEVAE